MLRHFNALYSLIVSILYMRDIIRKQYVHLQQSVVGRQKLARTGAGLSGCVVSQYYNECIFIFCLAVVRGIKTTWTVLEGFLKIHIKWISLYGMYFIEVFNGLHRYILTSICILNQMSQNYSNNGTYTSCHNFLQIYNFIFQMIQ